VPVVAVDIMVAVVDIIMVLAAVEVPITTEPIKLIPVEQGQMLTDKS
jgi:hypothetical protein